MRKIIFTTVLFFIAISLLSQAPQKFSFQAVIRNNQNQLIINQQIGVRTSIIQGSTSGTVVYKEFYYPNPQTNANGLITLEIGSGYVLEGNFAAINWAEGPFFIKTEADPNGLNNYTIEGISQLLSVPYALQAKTAETVTGGIIETDPVFMGSAAAGITGINITNWNTAFGWGNHSGLYRPVTWVPSWGDITGKPSNFPPSGHSHSATDITSGTLSVARGGTGATTFTSGNVLIGNGTGAITTLSRSGIDTRTTFPPSSHIHGNITDAGTIGSAAGRIITTGNGGALQATAGTATGQILYWNGTSWVYVAPGQEGEVLKFIGGKPTWSFAPVTITHDGLIYETVRNPTTGKIWLDRNLGAKRVAINSTDAASYGDLYQWGRSTDGHEIRTSDVTFDLSSGDTPGHGNFIATQDEPWDWRNPQNDNLWQGVNGINNPCPSGYRLPTSAEWNAELTSWSSSDEAGAFASPLKLPVAGFRDFGSGSIGYVCLYSNYWSSTVGGWDAGYLYFGSGIAGVHQASRAYGFSVRCIKE